MMLALVVLAWALVLDIGPGVALIVVSLTGLAVDKFDPVLINRILRRAPG